MTYSTDSWLSKDGDAEVGSIYVLEEDRFIVSLVVGYTDVDLQTVQHGRDIESRAKAAAAAALSLTTDDGSSGTTWYVFDRKTGQSFAFEQGDLEGIEVS